MKSPDRSQKGEMLRLKKKCDARAAAILSNSVDASDATLAHRVHHLTSVGHSLGTTCIQQSQFKKTQSKAISAFLTPLVFAPHNHGGLEHAPLCLSQGQRCFNLLLPHTPLD